MKNSKHKPALKWVGGKQRLIDTLLPHIPANGRLIEPFVGAGSVFLAAGDRDLVINDMNIDLMTMYHVLQEKPDEYIQQARQMFSDAYLSQDAYLDARSKFNASDDRNLRAVLFLYLNKFGFNGLYRVNKQGQFNVPYGHLKAVPAFPERSLHAVASKMENAKLLSGDFRETMALAVRGDVVYCDPPYVSPSPGKTSFVGYTSNGFTDQDQYDLATMAREIAARGATVIISNHDTPVTRELYDGMTLHSVEVRRSVAAAGDKRRCAKELIAVLQPS